MCLLTFNILKEMAVAFENWFKDDRVNGDFEK